MLTDASKMVERTSEATAALTASSISNNGAYVRLLSNVGDGSALEAFSTTATSALGMDELAVASVERKVKEEFSKEPELEGAKEKISAVIIGEEGDKNDSRKVLCYTSK